MTKQVIPTDVEVRGILSCTTLTIPSGTVLNAAVGDAAAIGVGKQQHLHVAQYAQANTAATDETRVVHVVYGSAGTIKAFKAGSIAIAAGNAITTVDLKKNGTTVLSAVITLDSANTNRVAEAGTLSVTSVVAGDVLEVVIDATIGTGTLPTGVFTSAVIEETGAP